MTQKAPILALGIVICFALIFLLSPPGSPPLSAGAVGIVLLVSLGLAGVTGKIFNAFGGKKNHDDETEDDEE